MLLLLNHAFICVFTCLYTYLLTYLYATPYVFAIFRALIVFDVAKGGEITTSGISGISLYGWVVVVRMF